MKYVKLLLALCLALSFSLLNGVHAQISMKESSMSLGSKPAFVVDIEGANKKLVEKKWKDFFKEYGKVEKNKKAKEHYVLQANLPSISQASNIYMKAEEGKDMTRVFLFVDNGSDFVSAESEEAGTIEKLFQDYAFTVDKEVAKQIMKDGEKELKGFEKDLSKLEKKNSKLQKDIENFKKKITEAEADIQQNLKDQDEAREIIESQKKTVEKLTDAYNNVGNG